MKYKIAVVAGDGIGPEVTSWATQVLKAVGKKYGHSFEFLPLKAGGCAIDDEAFGEPLPPQTLEAAKSADALLLGAVGGPKWDTLPGDKRPERALLGLRAGLGVFANLRPAALLPQLKDACPLKDEVLKASHHEGKAEFDLLIVRELTGGIYFGERGRGGNAEAAGSDAGAKALAFAFDTEKYSRAEIERVLRVGYEAAMKRRKKLTLVDKANVLESSRFWREVAKDVAPDYPSVTTDYLYVDNAAMQLIRAPGHFDVLVTSNLFGDILSDEASVLTGSIGMLASASIGNGHGLYEPIHGSAPDIAGKNLANPLAAILSAAMMLRYSFSLEKEAVAIENAVNAALDAGLRTADIASRNGNSVHEKIVGTTEMGEAVIKGL
ncbi:MAG: 3-isopropylmalate dehydrogenase [Spirochaetaceae bacterium]|jgi:3-isopropylmalate dehydrogenase|nr:3-isopropylmalate dehydrogenase [Spirochaetaceae bacterium]